ncbi:VWA domain-containing protein [uncultured Apibacter sp.]|uniref:vWA domain-containing protein n=1 Tax=uncultured Apibacter sp. TaxID=1778616 RepID=UPI0025CFEFBB|nr:VWA domain-containing protein [uncultured Apibacter sp.]
MNNNIEFGYPWFLVLLLIIPIFIFLKYRKRNAPKAVAIPNLYAFKAKNNNKVFFRPILFWLRLFIMILLILAIARPRVVGQSQVLESDKGIDIMLTVDVSLSMLAKDLNPDRLTALKKVAQNFIFERPIDRIGLIAYSGEALTMVPLTVDRNILVQQIENLKTQTLEGGTAIGVGLATAVNHLKKSKAKSKIVILMTDGVNNDGYVEPTFAADIAADEGIKVYTIGIGTNGYALFPTQIDQFTGKIYFEKQKVEIDEDLLKHIAQKTGGEYFRATDAGSLQNIYNRINKLEKSDINDLKYYNYKEKYRMFLFPALILLLIELFLRSFVFRSIN